MYFHACGEAFFLFIWSVIVLFINFLFICVVSLRAIDWSQAEWNILPTPVLTFTSPTRLKSMSCAILRCIPIFNCALFVQYKRNPRKKYHRAPRQKSYLLHISHAFRPKTREKITCTHYESTMPINTQAWASHCSQQWWYGQTDGMGSTLLTVPHPSLPRWLTGMLSMRMWKCSYSLPRGCIHSHIQYMSAHTARPGAAGDISVRTVCEHVDTSRRASAKECIRHCS